MPEVRLVAIESIRVLAPRLRSLGAVDALKDSISMGGLLQPIVLDRSMTLICGRHRLEACKLLGWTDIPAVIEDVGGPQAELAEIDENLCRRELSALERAEHIAKRKRLWTEIEAARIAAAPPPADGEKKKGKKAEKPREPELTAFVDDTAKRTGKAKRAIKEELKIGEMPVEVRDTIRETPISNNKRELLALTKMEPPAALEAASAVKSGAATTVRKKTPKKEKPAREIEVLDEEGLDAAHDAASEGPEGGFDAWGGPDANLVRERTRMKIIEAVESAMHALEKAESLMPSDDEGAFEGVSMLREALAGVTRVRKWLDSAEDATPWAAAS
jgi:ParB family chromosome partitioning protein